MKTVRQIMAETNALDNVALMKQMMAWPYERKVRHAEDVARAFWQRNTTEGRNLHVSVGGLDSIMRRHPSRCPTGAATTSRKSPVMTGPRPTTACPTWV